MKPWEKYQKPWEKYQNTGRVEPQANPVAAREFSTSEMMSNIPGSALQLGKDIVTPFIHPVDTGKAVYGLGRGLLEKLEPGVQENEKYPDAVMDALKGRYGSVDAAKQTAMKDPVGMLSDVAGGAGFLPKIGKVARAVDPINVGLNTAATGLKHLTPTAWPREWYKTAAKFRKTSKQSTKDIDRKIDTALDEGIMPTQAGVEKVYDKVFNLNDQVDDLIDAAANSPDGWLPADRVFRYIDDVKKDLGGFKADAAIDLKDVDNAVTAFRDHLKANNINTVTARQLQDFKKDIYHKIDFSMKQGKANYAQNQTKKSMARAAREDIETLAPDVSDINKREGALLDLLDPLEQAASRIDRRDFIGLGLPMKAVAGETVAPGGGLAGILLGLADNPKIKADMAIRLHQIQQRKLLQQLTNNKKIPLLTRQALIQAGRQNKEQY